MISLQNKKVRVIFKNGMSVDGIVQEWSNDLSILKNEDNDNLLLIYETSSNVMMVQVIVKETKEEWRKRRADALDALQKQEDEVAYHDLDNELHQGASDYIVKEAQREAINRIQPPDPEELILDHYEPDPTLRVQKLAELRKLQLQEHKAQLKQHIKTWKAGTVPQVKYTYPSKI